MSKQERRERNCREERSTPTLKMTYAPQELIEEIFLKLPAKSLNRFKCLSQKWRNTIIDPSFIKKHLSQSTNDPFKKRLFLISLKHLYYTKDKQEAQGITAEAAELLFPLMESDKKIHGLEILGSCDGLVCILDSLEDLFLLNPSTREFKKLTDSPFHEQKLNVYGFGYSSSTEDYEVARISICNTNNRSCVYSLETNSWRRIQDPYNFECFCTSKGIHIDGIIHWIARKFTGQDYTFRIASLNLPKGTFDDLPLPPPYDSIMDIKHCELGVLEGCLCVLNIKDPQHAEVWVMKRYGIEESWATSIIDVSQWHLRPCCFPWNGETVLGMDKQTLVLYNQDKGCCQGVQVLGLPYSINQVVSYVDSIFSINSRTRR